MQGGFRGIPPELTTFRGGWVGKATLCRGLLCLAVGSAPARQAACGSAEGETLCKGDSGGYPLNKQHMGRVGGKGTVLSTLAIYLTLGSLAVDRPLTHLEWERYHGRRAR